MSKIKKLKAHERDLIAVLKGKGVSNKQIAAKLGKHPTTIGREIKRNSFKGKYYVAIHAQAVYDKRKSNAGRRHPLKNPDMFKYVVKRLIRGWSPEQISGRVRIKYKDNLSMRICPETIYSFIYSETFKHRKFWEYLPRKQKKRKEKSGRKVHKSHIPDRVSIHLRSVDVDTRKEFGHWEGDTVEGKGHKNGIHTEAERKTRYLLASKVEKISSQETIRAQRAMFGNLPFKSRKSTTLDNGKENHLHTKLKNLGMGTYFADPYSSWQRGTNEYHNGLLRRYLPKGTDFDNLTQEELDDIVDEINSRPRKCLGYYTPKEVFLSELESQRVAIQPRM